MFSKATVKTPIKMEWVSITPAQADKILKHTLESDFPQRPILATTAKRYAEEMRHGTWHSHTADIIRLCPYQGGLAALDGQHRLKAISDSGRPQNCWVAEGVPKDAFRYVDQGTPRHLHHVFASAGWSSPAVMAQTGRMLYDRDRGIIPTLNKGTNLCSGTMFDEIVSAYGDMAQLWDLYGTSIVRAAKNCFCAKSVMFYSFYEWEHLDHDLSVAVINYLSHPTEQKPPHKIFEFMRQKLIEYHSYCVNQKSVGANVRTEVIKYTTTMYLRFTWSSARGKGGTATTQTGFTTAYNKWFKKVGKTASWLDYEV